jgi:hypothetical protein
MRFALAASLLLASCASVPPEERALAARVDAQSLRVIDNILRHEGAPPPAPPMVRELLARPFAAVDAASIFARAVPRALHALAEPAAGRAPEGPAVDIRELLEPYLSELAEAQRVLRGAQRGAPVDAAALLRELDQGLPSAARVQEAAHYDAVQLERATALFLEANARLVQALRAAHGRTRFPETAQRYTSAVGTVSIGTRGSDAHAAGAAVIVDPGGDDTYERAPVVGGAVAVIVDLRGDDRYRGADLAIHGLAAILDFDGDDAYESSGPGWGAAFAGASILIDFAGNDVYASGLFGQGTAAAGLGALIDLSGNDGYRLRAAGQGLGLAGGVGLLWDRGGDDRYAASGLRDPYERGGGLSFAQGTATGVRTALGGGIGILRDDAGNDDYSGQMYAQGAAYYYAIGLLWDRAGADHYRAVRYAQGNGVHEAIGVLRDESGDDRYELAVGVGQGMGLDLAVGILADLGGNDRYAAPNLAQGSATANGVGLLLDTGGADEWRMDLPNGWGRAEWSRGLPSLGLLLYDPARASFARRGASVAAPRADAPLVHEAEGAGRCPPPVDTPAAAGLTLGEALRGIGPGLVSGNLDGAAFRFALERLRNSVESALAELPEGDFDVAWSLAAALRCALEGADASTAARMWDGTERVLAARPATPFAGAIAGALRGRPAPAPQMERMLGLLSAHPHCSVRVATLSLQRSASAVQAALRSDCWRLQARALKLLDELGVAPENLDTVPGFLRQAYAASSAPRSASSRRSTARWQRDSSSQ